ncbi:Hypothetical protein SMAX5B_015330 [Scophthalmus maximus]|uniref:Uncharacterized protein n=1 Tax=Scophthalmus maximus TaxID=52904 RepID=A0A2U9C7K0_SCOMX|nr:Hypothetical protein SMAX5B_015330 [Scophthalmus maximus]
MASDGNDSVMGNRPMALPSLVRPPSCPEPGRGRHDASRLFLGPPRGRARGRKGVRLLLWWVS